MDDLQSLLRSLQGLYAQIASRLLDGRLGNKCVSAGPRDSVPIKDLLAHHIAKTTTAPIRADKTATEDQPAPGTEAMATKDQQEPVTNIPTEEQPALATEATPTGSATGPSTEDHERTDLELLGDLSKYFKEHQSAGSLEPYMREKMRVNTLDHINKALTLARQGHAEGASIHAELAESAMKAAAQYMSDDEYRLLREEVESRLTPKSASL